MARLRTVKARLKDKLIRAGRAIKDSVTTEDLKPYKSPVAAAPLKKKKKTGVNPFSVSRAQKTIRERTKEIDLKKILK